MTIKNADFLDDIFDIAEEFGYRVVIRSDAIFVFEGKAIVLRGTDAGKIFDTLMDWSNARYEGLKAFKAKHPVLSAWL